MKSRLVFVLGFVSILIMGVITAAPESAGAVNPPICYRSETADSVRVANCQNPQYRNAIRARFPDAPRNGHCYSVSGAFVNEYSLTGADGRCARLAELAAEVEEDPPGGGAGGDTVSTDFSNPQRARNLNCGNPEDCLEQNSLVLLITRVVRFFTVIIGVVITIVIIWSGFTYARAGGDPSKTAEAKNRIKNALIALAVFIFLEAGANWAIPGGLF